MGTPNDQAVLRAIFSPDTPFGDVPGWELEEDQIEKNQVEDEDDSFPGDLLEQAKNLELQGVTAAEAGNLSTALERFRQAINLLPGRASAYNNRAQARRLQGDVAGIEESPNSSLSESTHVTDHPENNFQDFQRVLPVLPFLLLCKLFHSGHA
ncbi:tetratricopeptide repeat protein 36 isoform X2 [Vombatus ursinus]|uniref:tetratricopeptide repeat protein 36 isoform X2 n=1 Tax=Vombatus ursinus TaxID=29139 RepID=UPI000FFD28A4|nr:tetratricopeptide repeat protein 36 isoform X2 [Vombatus ursinus]